MNNSLPNDVTLLIIEDILGITENEVLDICQGNYDKVCDLYHLSLLLESRLIPDRIPAIVRKRVESLNNRTLLEVFYDEGIPAVMAYLDHLYSYAGL